MLAGNDRCAAVSLERQPAKNKRYTELEPEAGLVNRYIDETDARRKTAEVNGPIQVQLKARRNTARTQSLHAPRGIQFEQSINVKLQTDFCAEVRLNT